MRKKATKPRVHIITMGCPKNVVDSEKLMAHLKLSGVEISPSLDEADVALINTCGFIEAAKQESTDAIIEQVKRKGKGTLKKVYAMGCLTERYREELAREIPEIDRVFGTNQMKDVVEEFGAIYRSELLGERCLSSPAHSAFLKISEGCDNPCSFCAIPIMRGKYRSRRLEEILSESHLLAEKGVKELVVIGQDTTFYGLDIYGKRSIAKLIESLADVEGFEWVRVMYAYPAKFPLGLLDVIAQHPHVCKYLDMPVQHISDAVLKSMRRGISNRALRELIETVRERVPGIALRTTLIVGYPTETPREFDELLDFVDKVEFDRLGVFTYSQEDGTMAFQLGDPVSGPEKEHRQALLMEAQKEISKRKNDRLIGRREKVIIDRLEHGEYVGRTEWDAPEIDNEVFVKSEKALNLGSFYDVDIVDAYEYDLEGRVQGV
jgi:ribosomal protein S12 methylthiotransferase